MLDNFLKTYKNATELNLFLIEYSPNKKIREYTAHSININPKNNDTLKKITFDKVCNFNKETLSIEDYTGIIIDDIIAKVDINTLLKENYLKLKTSIESCDTTTEFSNIKTTAYIISGKIDICDNELYFYLITKKNPLLNIKKSRNFFMLKNNTLEKATDQILELNSSFDMIILDNYLYTINNNFEKFFNIESSIKAICKKHLKKIKDINLINNFDEFSETMSSSIKNSKKFLTFVDQNLTYLEDIKTRKQVLSNLEIDFENISSVSLTEENMDMLAKYLCGKIKKDLIDKSIYEVVNSKKLN